MRKLLIILLTLTINKELKSNAKWNGLNVRIQGGLYADYLTMKTKKGENIAPKGVNAMFGWGVEYCFLIKKHFFVGLDLGFPYFDRILQNEIVNANPMFSDKKFYAGWLIFVPIPYVHLGYSEKDWVFTIGPTYYWAISLTARKALTYNTSVEFRHTWFVDRFIYSDEFHDMHFLFSLRYTF